MEPSFRQIAELFQITIPGLEPEVDAPARKKRGENAEESEELGRQSLSDGDYEAAIRHFKQAVQQRDQKDVGNTLVDLAGAYDYADQAPQAYREYQKALKAMADSPEPLLGISDLYRRYGRFRDSIEKLEEAIRLEPANAFYHIKLAEALREMGEPKRALLAAQGAVAAQPDESFYHYWVGDLCIQMERFEGALDALRAAIELSPGDDFLYLRAAVAFWRVDRRPEAIKAIRLASDLDPDKLVYRGLLETMLEEMGQYDEAALEQESAKRMDRYDRDTLGRTLGEMGLS
jgi:tetratricopeptide (TPR) repeat protein